MSCPQELGHGAAPGMYIEPQALRVLMGRSTLGRMTAILLAVCCLWVVGSPEKGLQSRPS